MNWPLVECLQYRTAFWIREGYAVRSLSRQRTARTLSEIAG